MSRNVKFLNQTLEELFSIFPPEDVYDSSREVVRDYLDSGAKRVGRIKWAELELNNVFVRGGISNAKLMSSQLISKWDEDPTIREIVEYANDTGLNIGELISAKSGDGYFWCVPYLSQETSPRTTNRIRVIYLTEILFLEILELFNSQAGLTPSEKHMVYQVVIGQNPNRAAKADGVSTETKRSQLKAATTKLNCHSQLELVRLMVSQLIQLIHLCETDASHIQLIERFSAQFFGANGRLSIQYLQNGRYMRYWEFGPINGRPLLVMHGYLFPFLVLDGGAELVKHNIRLIIPVRGGFLDDQIVSGSAQLTEMANDNIDDLLLFADCMFEDPVPIVGHNMGCVYAIHLAWKRPELFSRLILASIMLMRDNPDKSDMASSFASSLKKLASESGIYEFAARQLQKKVFSSVQTAKIILRRLFKDNPQDLDVINGVKGNGAAFEWFRSIALHSIGGFSSDVNLNAEPKENIFGEIQMPIKFIHGPHDPYTSSEEVKSLSHINPQSNFKILDEGGHYASASHPADFWNEINSAMNS